MYCGSRRLVVHILGREGSSDEPSLMLLAEWIGSLRVSTPIRRHFVSCQVGSAAVSAHTGSRTCSIHGGEVFDDL